MSRWLDEQVDFIYELLDLIDGSDHLSRPETASAPSGFAEPVRRVGTCGACGGTGCARCTKGRVIYFERDHYDKNPEPLLDAEPERGALSSSERAEVACLANSLSGQLVRVDQVYAPDLPQRRNGETPVERTALRSLLHWQAIKWLERRLLTAPVWVQEGARERDPEAVAWLAKRSAESGILRRTRSADRGLRPGQ